MAKYAIALTTLLALTGATVYAQAPESDTCTPLEVVGGGQTEVTKTVSVPGFLVNTTNWNTDWAIPGGSVFSSYVGTVVSADGGSGLDITMNFKYSDGSSEQAYAYSSTTLMAGEALVMAATPKRQETPAQVNLFVGGPDAAGVTYTASVEACQ